MTQHYPEFAQNLTKTGKYLRGGMLLMGALAIGVVGWSMVFKIQNGVIAPGTVIIEGETKTIQHLEGGTVRQVHVRDGDLVEIGDPLVTLDTTVLSSNQAQWSRQRLDLLGQIARLEAEKNNYSRISFPPALLGGGDVVRSIVSNQISIFEARRAVIGATQSQINERRLQFDNQKQNLMGQARAQQDQLRILDDELSRLRRGLEQGVVARVQYDAKERERIAIQGQIGTLNTELSRIDNQIRETYSGFEQDMQEREERVHEELREARMMLADVSQKLKALNYQLENSVITSPVAGLVHDLQLTTVNGVVRPGEDLLQIVPNSDAYAIKAQVSPTDIDQIQAGQEAMVRFSAFNQTTTPLVAGRVSYKPADHIVDQYTGMPYFEVKVTVSPEEFEQLNGLVIQAGMPSEVYLQTQKRSVASYIMKPVKDAMTRIGRSE